MYINLEYLHYIWIIFFKDYVFIKLLQVTAFSLGDSCNGTEFQQFLPHTQCFSSPPLKHIQYLFQFTQVRKSPQLLE